MGTGALLVGLALLVVTVAYVGRPFRPNPTREADDRVIEGWVSALRPAADSGRARFCTACGNPLAPSHRFCPSCGTPVVGED